MDGQPAPSQDDAVAAELGGLKLLAETALSTLNLARHFKAQAAAPANRLALATDLAETNGHVKAKIASDPAQAAAAHSQIFIEAHRASIALLVQQAMLLGQRLGLVRVGP